MPIRRKHLPLFISILCLVLIALSTSRLVASSFKGGTSPKQLSDPTSSPAPGETSPRWGSAYVWGPEGEELVTIDRATNAIVSRTQVGSFEDLAEQHLPLYQTEIQSYTAVTEVKKVYVLVYDPVLSNTQSLSDYLNWNSHAAITQGTIDFFQQASHNHVQYEVAYTTILTDGWPELTDGFRYTETTYLAVLNHQIPPPSSAMVNYTKIVNTPGLDFCGKLNRGEIDELWVYNGPYFGFWESTLVGPGAYWYNSPPVPGPTACNRLMPIMGPSPERAVPEAVHNFGHRTESTMTEVYGSWQQNRTSHNWERFALVKHLSPNYAYSGCGNIHFPPNATSDYNYNNPATVNTNCDDFANYPNLSDPPAVQPVTCSAWSCDHLAYLGYWFSHLPANPACGPDSVANDWWKYFANPALALNPPDACLTTPTPTPTATHTLTPTPTPTLTPTATVTPPQFLYLPVILRH